MVQINAVVVSAEESKRLLKDNTPVENNVSNNKDTLSEKRFKLVSPYPRNCCNNCMFFTFNFLMRHPVIGFIVCIVFLMSFAFIGPTVCYIRCFLQATIGNEATLTVNQCYDSVYTSTFLIREERKTVPFYSNQCMDIKSGDRLYCLPQDLPDEQECISRGCCWSSGMNESLSAPHCFYPSNYKSYEFINVTATNEGAVAFLKIVRNSSYPDNIPILRMNFNYWAENMLEVKIYNPLETRYEPQFPELPPLGPSAAKNTKYVVNIDKEKFGFQIVRKSNNQTVFDTQEIGGFIFANQLIQMSAHLPSTKIYGLGQQRNRFMLDLNWTTITLFNHDQPPKDGTNLYGSHPFYLAMEEGGLSNGVLLLNSNAMDIVLSPSPSITYRTTGGVLDFFIFLGPTPADVLRQYTQLVGRPFLPPYWSLGFHLCKFGYKTLNETIKVWNRTRTAKIPFDTQWNDLDYMKNGNDFTYDKELFEGLPDFVDLLHKEGMHYMVLVDPGVSAGELPGAYPPFDKGIALEIFILDHSGVMPFVGKVWNKKSTVFVDFFNPAAVSYWMEQLRDQHKMFAFDGAWIDMNDPSNFLDGTKSGCPNSTLDNPPYLPAVRGDKLYYRTVCMSAKHSKGQSHYNLHNVYALAEAIVTSFAMQQIRAKRAFVISRSSFPGLGRYAGVWTGDIASTWDDMAQSVSDILSFSLYGISMSGADICGFNGNSTVALCQRWSQLGAFYPFSRNHNSDLSSDQDPVALGPAVVEAARTSLLVRYSLLPYLYTLFWHAHAHGDTVARPMFFEFPHDNKTYTINTQFLWGPALLIVPVLKEGATNVTAYLPKGEWYDFYSYKMIRSNGSSLVLSAPLETIPLLLRGGFIVPTQRPELTTTHSRSNPVDLIVALNHGGQASGDLYWDDGDSLDHNEGVYNLMNFIVENNSLHNTVQQLRFLSTMLVLGDVRILGVKSIVNEVTVGGRNVSFEFHPDIKMLHVTQLYLDLSKSFELKWK